MRIQKRRIRNPQRYLFAFSPGDELYVVAPLLPALEAQMAQYGISTDGVARIPRPIRTATTANADGYVRIKRDLPKEYRNVEHDYHIVDWHGTDHYGTCVQRRLCYQREYIPPTELAFKAENGVLFSPIFCNREQYVERIKAAANVLLEMFGFCEFWTSSKAPAVPPIHQEEVPWEILRAGSRNQAEWEEYLDAITRMRPESHRVIIKDRHEHLWKQKPDFCVLGTQNFWGYVVYGFLKKDLYFFESNQVNNATYVFRGDWKGASQLTKTEILTGHRQETRLLHTERWYENVRTTILRYDGGAS